MLYGKWLLLFLITGLLLACASTGQTNLNDPEFAEGMQMGKEYARKDTIGINCIAHPLRSISVPNWARRHNKTLNEQGRSEMFKQGFYFEYQREFPNAHSLQCE